MNYKYMSLFLLSLGGATGLSASHLMPPDMAKEQVINNSVKVSTQINELSGAMRMMREDLLEPSSTASMALKGIYGTSYDAIISDLHRADQTFKEIEGKLKDIRALVLDANKKTRGLK